MTRSWLRSWHRATALSAAGFFSVLLLVNPYILNGIPQHRVRTGLPLTMLGCAGLFVYGFGFRTSPAIMRIVLHPAAAWFLFGIGLLVLVSGEH